MTRDIGLALSGGGFRAVAFHLGCLRALHDRGLLSRVRVISGVSGGALLAALYAYGHEDFQRFDEAATELLRGGLEFAVARQILTTRRGCEAGAGFAAASVLEAAGFVSWLAQRLIGVPPTGEPDGLTPHRVRSVNRTTVLADVLAGKLYGDRAMGDEVSHPGLDVVLTACDLGTGAAVRFGSHSSACSRFGEIINAVPVAVAAAASAGYPALLPALEQKYRFRNRAGQEVDRVVLLTDGGVYDNLALSVLNPERDPIHTTHVYDVDYVIACDAGPGQLRSAAPHLWPTRMQRVVGIMHQRAQHGERGRLYAAEAVGQLHGFVFAYLGMQDRNLPIPLADLVPREAVSRYPTNFRAMSTANLDSLSTRGEQLVRVLVPHYCPDLC